MKARRPELLRERNLATWLVKSDTEFAELIVQVGRDSYCDRNAAPSGNVFPITGQAL